MIKGYIFEYQNWGGLSGYPWNKYKKPVASKKLGKNTLSNFLGLDISLLM